MFKNLDGFKKIHETADTAIMRHAKGHTVTIAKNALPSLHRKQITALPLHRLAEGGKIVKYVEGGGTPESALKAMGADSVAPSGNVPDYTYREGRDNWADFQNMMATTPVTTNPKYDPAAEFSEASGIPSGSQNISSPDDKTSRASLLASNGPIPPDAVGEQTELGQGTDGSGANPERPIQAVAKPDMAAGVSPNSIYGLQMGGLKEQAEAEKKIAAEEKSAGQEYQDSLVAASQRWDNDSKDLVGHIKGALTDVQNGTINPKQYMENMSTPAKVANAIGLFLGGFSTAYTHQGNPALDMLNKQIDRDIDAQKTGLNNKMNIYHAYLEQYKNAAVAENMTRATQLAIYGSKLKQAALNNANPLIMARYKQGEAAIQSQILPLVQSAQLYGKAAQFQGPGQTGTEADYQMLTNAAQRLNPAMYKDLQEKYIPGIGTTAVPAKREDIDELSTYKNLNDLAKQAQDFAQNTGRTFWGTNANQKANDVANQAQLQIGQLVNLKRINEFEAKKYEDLFRSPGSWNQGAAIQSFKDFQNDIHGKTKAIVNKLQIKPFRR